MTSTRRIHSIITRIANQHGLDLSTSVAHLRLEKPGYMPLVIEKIGKNLLSVAHYYTQNGTLIADPDVVFFISGATWVPYEITHSPGLFRRVAGLSADGTTIAKIDTRAMVKLARFCETWARNLEAQNWLEPDDASARNRYDVPRAGQSTSSLV